MERVEKPKKKPIYCYRIAELMTETLINGKPETQHQLAEALGVNRDRVNNWLNNRSEIDIDNLLKIAKHYGVSVDYLVDKDNTTKSPDPAVIAVREKTDLSESAIENLLGNEAILTDNSSLLLNALLEHPTFLEDMGDAFNKAWITYKRIKVTKARECFSDDILVKELNRKIDGEYPNRFTVRTSKQAFNDYAQDIASLIKELIQFKENQIEEWK